MTRESVGATSSMRVLQNEPARGAYVLLQSGIGIDFGQLFRIAHPA